jgi:integrase
VAEVLLLDKRRPGGEQFVSRVTEDGVYRDGGGLYLQVTNDGKGKSWLFRYTFEGKAKTISLGTYRKGVTLAKARDRAREANDWLWQGKDPKQQLETERQKEKIEAGRPYLVNHFADIYVNTVVKDFEPRTQVAAERFIAMIRATIGDMPIKAFERDSRALVVKTGLYDLWRNQRGTAKQLRWHLCGIFNQAAVDHLDRNPTDAKYLKVVLPRGRHHAKARSSIPFEDVPRFLARLRTMRDTQGPHQGQYPTIALLLEMIIFSGVRSQEPREAQWKEIKWEERVWEVPPGHLKVGKRHNKMRPIPLTRPMLAVLEQMKERRLDPSDDEALIFPPSQAQNGNKPFDDSLLSRLTRELKWEKPVTPHGFRNTLKDWAEEKGWEDILVERQQDHLPKDGTATAVRYSHLVRAEAKDRSLSRRREMMEAYADFCDPPNNDVQF